MAKENVSIKVYVENLKAGVSEEDIIKAAVEAGDSKDQAAKNLEKAQGIVNMLQVPDDEDRSLELAAKMKELLRTIEEAKTLSLEVAVIRAATKQSNTIVMGVSRELKGLCKVISRYVEA